MIELTRELLERYLRATGWTLHDNPSSETSRWRNSRHALCLVQGHDLDASLRSIAEWSGQPTLSDLSFRLGLCAAAERLRECIRVNIDEETFAHHVLTCESNAMLRNAGIEPAAWEAAK